MRLTVLGSGSRGNAAVLETGGASLLVDAGFGVRSLTRRLETAGVRPESLLGIVLTHEHGDHARGTRQFARRHSLPVLASAGTLQVLFRREQGIETLSVEPHRPTTVGPFTISSCHTTHDAAEPLALAVESSASRCRVGIAYDLGHVTPEVRALLRGCHGLLVEANHDDGMLRTGPYPASVRHRIAGARGHLSNRAAAQLVGTLCHAELRVVVLAHLSDSCNEPQIATTAVRNALAQRSFTGTLVVARQREPLAALSLAKPVEQLTLDMAYSPVCGGGPPPVWGE